MGRRRDARRLEFLQWNMLQRLGEHLEWTHALSFTPLFYFCVYTFLIRRPETWSTILMVDNVIVTHWKVCVYKVALIFLAWIPKGFFISLWSKRHSSFLRGYIVPFPSLDYKGRVVRKGKGRGKNALAVSGDYGMNGWRIKALLKNRKRASSITIG